MKTTMEYLDAVKARLGLPSDYAAAPILGVTRSSVSRYRSGAGTFDDETAARVAEILDIQPMEVIASSNFERAKEPRMRKIWEQAWWEAYAGKDYKASDFVLCQIGLRFPLPAAAHRAA